MSEAIKSHFNMAAVPPAGWSGDTYFRNPSGKYIRYAHMPAKGDKKGTVVLTHGYGESIDLYYETMKEYQNRGYEIYAMDWAGFGKSERDNPKEPDTPDARNLLNQTKTLHHFVTNVVRRDPDKPLLLHTHSMGGQIALLYLKKHPDVFDGAIMSSPMFDIYRLGLPKFLRPAVRFVFSAASKLGLGNVVVPGGIDLPGRLIRTGKSIKDMALAPINNIREEWRNIIKAWYPETTVSRPTFGWLSQAFKTAGMVMKESYLREIKTPILLGSAGRENMVDNSAHDKAAKVMGDKLTHVFMKNAGHNLWHETDENYKEWWSHVNTFLRAAENRIAARNGEDANPVTGVAVRDKPESGKDNDVPPSCIPPNGGRNNPPGLWA